MMMYQVLVERFADVEISLGGHNDHAVHAARQSNLKTGEVNTMSIKVFFLDPIGSLVFTLLTSK